MRYPPARLTAAALAFALVLGCSDRPGVTDPDDRAAPSFDVSRFEQPEIIFFGQEQPPIAALLGVTAEEFPAFCASTLEPQLMANTMIVTHPTKQGPSPRKCSSQPRS
jgi:hypothetical protein